MVIVVVAFGVLGLLGSGLQPCELGAEEEPLVGDVAKEVLDARVRGRAIEP